MKNKDLIILVSFLAVVALVTTHLIARFKKKNELQEIRDRINSGAVGGGNTILGILVDTNPSNDIDAKKVAEYLDSSTTWESSILDKLGTLSKSQIKAVALAYPSANGKSMDDGLRSDFGSDDFNQILSIIRSAK